jgi:hypothetical protein
MLHGFALHFVQPRGVPITNYGLAIAYSLGIFERALEPFPAALDLWRNAARNPAARTPTPALKPRERSACPA